MCIPGTLQREACYQVKLIPPNVDLPDCGLFKTDLVIIHEIGSLLFMGLSE
jgi:hypothetical protein